MRRQIGWLTAATTSAIVLAFVIPLCLLVRTLAEDRALALAEQEARDVAILVSSLAGDPALADLVLTLDGRSESARTQVLTPDGQVLGGATAGLASDPEVERAAAGTAFTRVDDRGAAILVPVLSDDGTWVVRTVVPQQEMHRGVTRAWLFIVGLGLLLLLSAVVVSGRLARRISTPVTDLATVAHRLREGDLDARAQLAGPPETVELADAFNRLAERIVELLAAERAAVGDLSHRLRTPLTALRLDVESVTEPEPAERLRVHIGQLQRTVDAIVKDARRPVRHTMTSVADATAVVRERAAFWSALAEDEDRRVDIALPAQPCLVGVDEVDLRDIVDILVDNVFAHTPEGVGFSIGLAVGPGRAVLSVRDEGAPQAGAHRPQAGRVGVSGLGLQIVRRAAAGFRGEVEVRAEGQGFLVEVGLPLADRGGPRP